MKKKSITKSLNEILNETNEYTFEHLSNEEDSTTLIKCKDCQLASVENFIKEISKEEELLIKDVPLEKMIIQTGHPDIPEWIIKDKKDIPGVLLQASMKISLIGFESLTGKQKNALQSLFFQNGTDGIETLPCDEYDDF